MTERERDLYEKHQTLVALVGVLLHELRNPLHGATLLVEAMGMKSADIPTLRGKLKNQFTKLEAIMSEVAQPVKELALAPQIEAVEVAHLLSSAQKAAEKSRTCDAEVHIEGAQAAKAMVDPVLLEQAIVQLLLRSIDPEPMLHPPTRITVRVEALSPSEVRIVFEDDGPVLDETAQRSAFSLAAGGVRLATSRALTTLAGGSMRLERVEGRGARLVMLLPVG